ncbi:uncharacterized protein [Argopecten irradians]|uniref:uncharacterized protein isoform X1 n=2 Tax=Argopecten irradians TaxID=31199 RepID=UPI00372071AB
MFCVTNSDKTLHRAPDLTVAGRPSQQTDRSLELSLKNNQDLFKMMSKHNIVLFLVIFAGVCPDQGNCFCWPDAALAAGAGAAAVVAAPVVVPAALGAVGFSAAGTAAGSAGAALMSTYGGSIAAGSAVSVMQSVGAAGIGVAGKAVAGTVAAGVAYTMAGGNCDPKVEKCEP